MKSMSSHVLHTSPTHCAHRGVKVCDVWIQYLIFFFSPSTSPLITRAGKVQVSSFFSQARSSLYSHTISLCFPVLLFFCQPIFFSVSLFSNSVLACTCALIYNKLHLTKKKSWFVSHERDKEGSSLVVSFTYLDWTRCHFHSLHFQRWNLNV